MLDYPVMYSLSERERERGRGGGREGGREGERERERVNMQGTVFTLARLKTVPTIKNLICRCLLYDCET